MTTLSKRQAVVAVIVSSILFTIALALFCFALGLDFVNEGWAPRQDGESVVGDRQVPLVLSLVGFAISIVLFFVGLHRIAKP